MQVKNSKAGGEGHDKWKADIDLGGAFSTHTTQDKLLKSNILQIEQTEQSATAETNGLGLIKSNFHDSNLLVFLHFN